MSDLSHDNLYDDLSIFKEIVEQNIAGLILLENDIITYANPSFCNIFDKNTNHVIGISILDQIIPEDHHLFTDIINNFLSGNTAPQSQHFRYLCCGGQKYFSLHLKSIKTIGNNKIRIVGASRDSTSRVLTAKEKQLADTRYNVLYQNMPDGIFIYNYDLEKVIDHNEAAIKILKYQNKELKGKSRFDIIPKHSKLYPEINTQELTVEHGNRVRRGESFYTFGVFQPGDNSPEIYADVNVVPTFAETAEAYIIFHEITDNIKRSNALKSSNKRYQDIFQNSHEAIAYFDIKSGKLLDCNTNAIKLYGAESKEQLMNLATNNFYELIFKNKKNAPSLIRKKIAEALSNGQSFLTVEAINLKGEPFIYEGVIIIDETIPQKPKMLTFARNIKNIRDAEKEKNKLINQLVKAKQEIDERNNDLKRYIESNLQLENFAYFASHDLRTPLRSIISFTQLLKRSIKDKMSFNEKEYMEYIENAGKSMQKLIDDLLSFSRINTKEALYEKINLNDLFNDVNKKLISVIQEKEVQIKIQPIPETIFADSTKLKQLFQNLISNAIKFVPKDTQPIINISGKEQKEEWAFSVSDNGIGIDEAYKEKIFLMFKRLHNSTEYEGTGIGLALCKKVIEQHDGKIWFDSKIGEGTTFHFTIKKGLNGIQCNA